MGLLCLTLEEFLQPAAARVFLCLNVKCAGGCECRLRRYFGVTAQVPYTDVWTHKPVQFYPGKHPCEKPAEMLQQIISASSRPGDLVADFFMGSGSTVKAALALGRRATGVELETERFEQTVREVQDLVSQNG